MSPSPTLLHQSGALSLKVSLITQCLQGQVISLMPNPQPGGPGTVLCQGPIPQPIWHSWTIQGLHHHWQSSWGHWDTQALPPQQGDKPRVEIHVHVNFLCHQSIISSFFLFVPGRAGHSIHDGTTNEAKKDRNYRWGSNSVVTCVLIISCTASLLGKMVGLN